VNQVFVGKDTDEGSAGHSYKRAYDAGDSSTAHESDKNGDRHEIDAGAHDPWGQVRGLDLRVDAVEDEDEDSFRPGVDGGDGEDNDDGYKVTGDGDDVGDTHEDAKQDKVAYTERAEDDDAVDALDTHEQKLADEPAGDTCLRAFECGPKTDTWREGKERE